MGQHKGARMISIETVKGADQARELIDIAMKWYGQRDTASKVLAEAHKVRDWMLENKHKTNNTGDEISEPWWPKLEKLDQVTEGDRLDLRRSFLRMRIYGNGMRRLLNRMVAAGLLSNEALEVIDDLTSFACMAFHEELVGYTLSKNPETTVSLVDLKKRFGLSERTNPTKMRNGIVLRMASFGLWEVKIDKEGRYAIKLGPVAKVFHSEVFSPVRKKFEPLLSGEK